MKNYFFLFFFLICFSISAQKNKPILYLNENGYQISKELYQEEYQNRKYNISYLSLTFENDTSYFVKPVKRKNYGRLNNEKSKKNKLFCKQF